MTNDENWAGYRAFLEEFIEIYRGQPCLWRVKSKEYHDRNKKERAYDELIRHYRKIEPNADREAIVKKINNLRTAYRKEVKKVNDTRKSGLGEEEGYVPKLWYFHLLDFLNEQEPPKSLATNGEV
ncbi:hypothetical protein AAG570_001736 [Ranatra chinensis]|uniref:MADF domain-containing protein n=1 Tax=Ranatra chinensis TaxID=642074 RepID=A0ABD0Y9N8_9HEMI